MRKIFLLLTLFTFISCTSSGSLANILTGDSIYGATPKSSSKTSSKTPAKKNSKSEVIKSASGKTDTDPIKSHVFTDEEKGVLSEINYARTNPKDYVNKRLKPLLNTNLSDSTKAALNELINQMNSMAALPSLSFSNELGYSAYELALEFEQKGGTSYTSNWDRLSKYGTYQYKGEIVSFGNITAEALIKNLLINENSAERKQRKTLLAKSDNSVNFKIAGVAVAGHPEYTKTFVIDFGSENTNPSSSSGTARTTTGARVSSRITNSSSNSNTSGNSSSSTSSSANSNITSHVPTAEENDIIAEINYARTNPKDYVNKRLKPIQNSSGNTAAYKTALNELISQMNSMPAKPALRAYNPLFYSAYELGLSMQQQNSTGPAQIEWDRFLRYGEYAAKCETKMFGNYDAVTVVRNFLVDASNADRGNRSNLLGTNEKSQYYTVIGVAAVSHPSYTKSFVIDIATESLSSSSAANETAEKYGITMAKVKAHSFTSLEKSVVTEMNLARTKPKDYVRQKLQPLLSTNMTERKRAALTELINYMNSMQALSALTFDNNLGYAAYEWALVLEASNTRGHSANLKDRILKYASVTVFGENIQYSSDTAEKIVISLLIDDGVDDRGHRKNILGMTDISRRYTKAGVGITNSHPTFGKCCVTNFGGN